ncbi:MAG TPA: protein-glutamate O-methyltransferase CheR [Clostridiales bacterium]|nr:protein-glutamate O-methyltransferase CheR [Clostridiales bacterium]
MSHWNYGEFTDAVRKLTDIDLSAYNERQMKRRIDAFLSRSKHQNYNGFYNALVENHELRDKFINFLTINVTEFFRNPPQWEKLKQEIIPKLLELPQPLRVWSSACSTGEEPYSMAMLLNQFMDLKSIRILATDIDEAALVKARKGVYDKKTVKNLSKEQIAKYFDEDEENYYIKDELKACVHFKKLNLLVDPFPVNYHLILCRNVMIYFTQEAKERLYRRFYSSLLQGGVLFIGNTEQIINPGQYGFVSQKSFFYTKR